jgi:hypothetical protein
MTGVHADQRRPDRRAGRRVEPQQRHAAAAVVGDREARLGGVEGGVTGVGASGGRRAASPPTGGERHDLTRGLFVHQIMPVEPRAMDAERGVDDAVDRRLTRPAIVGGTIGERRQALPLLGGIGAGEQVDARLCCKPARRHDGKGQSAPQHVAAMGHAPPSA